MKIKVGTDPEQTLEEFIGNAAFHTPPKLAASFSRLLQHLWIRGDLDERALYEIVTGLSAGNQTIILLETPDRGDLVVET